MGLAELSAPEICCQRQCAEDWYDCEVYLECPVPGKEHQQCNGEYDDCNPSQGAMIENRRVP